VTEETASPASLSLGVMVGGTGSTAKAWKDAATSLSERVRSLREDVASPLSVNVVFQIPGDVVQVKFTGVRTGRYSPEDRHLLVQAAVPEGLPADPRPVLVDLLRRSVEEAVRFARKKGLAQDLPSLRGIVDQL
jgi:hypothetical protein